MANPDQKTILLEQAYDELKEICTKFQDESGATDIEVKTLLRELARVYEKDYWWLLQNRLGSVIQFFEILLLLINWGQIAMSRLLVYSKTYIDFI